MVIFHSYVSLREGITNHHPLSQSPSFHQDLPISSHRVTLLRVGAAFHGIGWRHRQGAIAVLQARGHGVHAGDLAQKSKFQDPNVGL